MSTPENIANPEIIPTPEITPTPKYKDFQRIIGTLLFPSEVFKDINIKPSLLVALLLSIIVSLSSTLIILKRVNVNWEDLYSKVFEEQLIKQGKNRADLSQQEKDALDNQVKMAAKAAPYFVYINPIVYTSAFPVILALIFFGGITLMGGVTTYTKILSVVIHIFCVVTICIQSVLNLIVVFLKDPKDIDITKGALIASNPGMLMPEGTSKLLLAVLSQFDIFTIWSLVLLSIGLPIISKNLSKQFALITTFGLWSMYAFVAIALKVIFS